MWFKSLPSQKNIRGWDPFSPELSAFGFSPGPPLCPMCLGAEVQGPPTSSLSPNASSSSLVLTFCCHWGTRPCLGKQFRRAPNSCSPRWETSASHWSPGKLCPTVRRARRLYSCKGPEEGVGTLWDREGVSIQALSKTEGGESKPHLALAAAWGKGDTTMTRSVTPYFQFYLRS